MMALSNRERACVLAGALPHIRRCVGRTVVVKYGGNAMINDELKQQVMEDIVLLWSIGVRVVLVHGGGPEISEMMERLGKRAEFVDGLRVTDRETVDIVQMVLAGRVGKTLVALLEAKGGRAIGLAGMDGGLIVCRTKDPRLGYVGQIASVDPRPVHDLLERGYIPVISTIGCDEHGNAYNINGDTASAAVAGAMRADRLIMMTDVAGLLRDRDDPSTLIRELTVEQARELRAQGVVAGGMIPKLECCVDAIEAGVGSAVIMDGRVPHSILMELLTDEGAGTTVRGGSI